MFSRTHQAWGSFTLVTLQDKTTGAFVTVNPTFGGMLHQLGLPHEGTIVELLDTYADADALLTQFADTYKGAKLCPFPNMINQGRYSFAGETYRLPINWAADGHAIHGFVADKPFAILHESADAEQAALTVGYTYSGDLAGFPFPFRMTLTYQLRADAKFSCRTRIQNTGPRAMPLGDGWHPYFTLGGLVDDWLISLPADALVEVDEHFIPSGQLRTPEYSPAFTRIGNQPIDACYRVKTSQPVASTQLVNGQRGMAVAVWQETGLGKYEYVQLYASPDRRSLAVEPMSCPPDALNSGQSLCILQPDGCFDASFGIYVHKTPSFS